MLIVISLTLAIVPPRLADFPPPYAAGYVCARPQYYQGRSWAPTQPWFYLPGPVFERRRPGAWKPPA